MMCDNIFKSCSGYKCHIVNEGESRCTGALPGLGGSEVIYIINICSGDRARPGLNGQGLYCPVPDLKLQAFKSPVQAQFAVGTNCK